MTHGHKDFTDEGWQALKSTRARFDTLLDPIRNETPCDSACLIVLPFGSRRLFVPHLIDRGEKREVGGLYDYSCAH